MEEIGIGEFSRRSRLSVKALRLYDELGVLLPARVDSASGYRYYDAAQLGDARLIAMLRQLEFPLAMIKQLLESDPGVAAERIATHWREVEVARVEQRQLVEYLVNQLNGKERVMLDVATREMPERSILCLKRNVDQDGAWALGKEFISMLRARPVPQYSGREGAMFCIFWGEVSADSDGPIEFCKPIPAESAESIAAQYPDLKLRIEPAHREAFVGVSADGDGVNVVQWQLASMSLGAWANEKVRESLTLKPEDLGMRLTYLAVPPITETSVPDCDFAVPYV
jgi:DNA-binding transcriptional MerR regulator